MNNKPQVFVALLSDNQLAAVEFGLPQKTRTGIIQALKVPAGDSATVQFLELLESELGGFMVLEAQRKEQASIKHRVDALNKLSASITTMIARLEGLDAISRRTLKQAWMSEKGIGPCLSAPVDDAALPNITLSNPLNDFDQDSKALLLLLDALGSAFKKQITPGAPPKKARQHLIDAILRNYQVCFGQLPSSTTDGSFEQVLHLSLESIHIVISDLHSEIVQSLKRVRGK